MSCDTFDRLNVIGSLCSSGLESAYSLYPSLSKLLCLLELEEAGSEVNRLGFLTFVCEEMKFCVPRTCSVSRSVVFPTPMHAYILHIHHTLTHAHLHPTHYTLGHTHMHSHSHIQIHTPSHPHITHYAHIPSHTHTHWCSSVSVADPTFLSDWKKRLPYIKDSDFQFVEPVLALRSSILHSLLRRTAVECAQEASPPIHLRRKVERVFGGLTDTLLTQARLAREAGRYQVSN